MTRNLGLQVVGLGFGVSGLGFRVQGFGFRVLGFRVYRVEGLGYPLSLNPEPGKEAVTQNH